MAQKCRWNGKPRGLINEPLSIHTAEEIHPEFLSFHICYLSLSVTLSLAPNGSARTFSFLVLPVSECEVSAHFPPTYFISFDWMILWVAGGVARHRQENCTCRRLELCCALLLLCAHKSWVMVFDLCVCWCVCVCVCNQTVNWAENEFGKRRRLRGPYTVMCAANIHT